MATPSANEFDGTVLASWVGKGEIAEILAATRTLPAWRACEVEGMG
jgi:hypothetical protein